MLLPMQDNYRAMRREISMLCLIFVLYAVVSGFVNGSLSLLNMGGSSNITDHTVSNIHLDRLMLLSYLGTYVLMFVVPLSVFFLLKSRDRVTDYFYLNRSPQWGIALLGSLGVLALNYAVTILADAGNLIFARVGLLADVPDLMGVGDDAVSNVIYFVILVIAPAILEEFCFRGVICGRLAQFNSTAAIILSAILFAFMHMNLEQMPFAFLAGLLLGYVYLRTGSIWSSVLIHAVNNGFSFFSEYLYHRYDGAIEMERLYMLGWAGLFGLGLIALVVLGLSHKEADTPPLLKGGQAMTAALSSPLFLICCLLALITTVLVLPI